MSWVRCDYCNTLMSINQHGECPRCGAPVDPSAIKNQKREERVNLWQLGLMRDGKYDRDIVLHESEEGGYWMGMYVLVPESKKAPMCRCGQQTIAVRWYDGQVAHACVECMKRYPPEEMERGEVEAFHHDG